MLKKLLHELKEFKIPSILASSFMVGEVILELLLPYLMSYATGCYYTLLHESILH